MNSNAFVENNNVKPNPHTRIYIIDVWAVGYRQVHQNVTQHFTVIKKHRVVYK